MTSLPREDHRKLGLRQLAQLSAVLLLLLNLRSPFSVPCAADIASNPAPRIARWTGGPLELKRREILGELPSDRSKIESTLLNWYSSSSIELLKRAKVNDAWLTWSVGLPSPDEKAHDNRIREYIQHAQQAGIRSLALVSGTRLFSVSSTAAADLRVLKNAADKPLPCEPAKLRSGDVLNCYQADLKDSTWRAQVMARSLEALAAGADGIVLEGIAGPYDQQTAVGFVDELQQKLIAANPKARLVPLVSRDSLTWFPSLPQLFIEDGLWPRVRPTSISFEQGEIVVAGASQGPWIDLNLWLIAYAQTAGGGQPWHLAFQADRTAGVEPDVVLPKGSLALAAAESAAFGGSFVLSLDDALRIGLNEERPEALEQWKQAIALQDFVSDTSLRSSWKPVNNTAVVIQNVEDSEETLNLIGRRGLAYAVVLQKDLEKAPLTPYALVIAMDLPDLGKPGLQHLLAFARAGGIVVTNPPNGPDETFQSAATVDESPNFATYSAGKGQWVVYKEPVSNPDEFAQEVRTLIPQEKRSVRLWNAPAVFTRLTSSNEGPHRLQLVNYALEPIEELQAQVKGSFRGVQFSSPELPHAVSVNVKAKDGFTEFTVPKLNIYGLVTLE
jgi:hypothetical protein